MDLETFVTAYGPVIVGLISVGSGVWINCRNNKRADDRRADDQKAADERRNKDRAHADALLTQQLKARDQERAEEREERSMERQRIAVARFVSKYMETLHIATKEYNAAPQPDTLTVDTPAQFQPTQKGAEYFYRTVQQHWNALDLEISEPVVREAMREFHEPFVVCKMLALRSGPFLALGEWDPENNLMDAYKAKDSFKRGFPPPEVLEESLGEIVKAARKHLRPEE
ncbi:hypothetical protein [Corynebacterium sp. TAE3-ERU16]|uniref:hypothetical protein n=1 Tax=Corynebacterium sp. TAE3-ERU16 TaxID=2849493 RepID=UPI001C44324B|nr:hypothetical protein [Corynebacterium sp. TAE3-ERU16]MBV7292365.1 hypothetical protein [Corynebacterium sp. TAE3-ERU16]